MNRSQYLHRSAALVWLPGLALALATVAGAQDAADEITVVDGQTWAVQSSGAASAWADANEYCETLEAGGRDDWRLPTLFELESLFDPDSATALPATIELDDCCAWSSTNLVMLEPEAKADLPDPAMGPDQYYWGLLFPDGIRYYSMSRFPDGVALCTRDTGD